MPSLSDIKSSLSAAMQAVSESIAERKEKELNSDTQKAYSGEIQGITVQSDPSIELPEIKVFLSDPSPDETDEDVKDSDMRQTKTQGIAVPLVRVNGLSVPFNLVEYMYLSCDKFPMVKIGIMDQMDLFSTFDKPGKKRELQVQIIPSFDNAYKKINLPFYITSFHKDEFSDVISISGTYSVKGMWETVVKSYGEITTYEFFKQVAADLGLGFCSNLSGTDDKRWIYVPSEKITSALSREADFGGSDADGNKSVVLDWWIDYWNCLNLVDISERANTIDDKDSMKIWITNTLRPETDEAAPNEPVQSEAMITNHIALRNTQVYCSKYSNVFTASTGLSGQDRYIEYFDSSEDRVNSLWMKDEDAGNDIFSKYDYIGENFGEYQYLTQQQFKTLNMMKLNGEKYSVDLFSPVFGLTRGSKVNFYWYDVNPLTDSLKYADLESNIPLPEDITEKEEGDDFDPATAEDEQILNRQVSGQYYIASSEFIYDYNDGGFNWQHRLTLTRPEDQKCPIEWKDILPEQNT